MKERFVWEKKIRKEWYYTKSVYLESVKKRLEEFEKFYSALEELKEVIEAYTNAGFTVRWRIVGDREMMLVDWYLGAFYDIEVAIPDDAIDEIKKIDDPVERIEFIMQVATNKYKELSNWLQECYQNEYVVVETEENE